MLPQTRQQLQKKTSKINWRRFFSLKLIDLFAIAAVAFAYIQFHDAKKTLETLPTRYMADFPENIGGIIDKIILPSQQSLTIISDYPIYGIYSNSQKAVEYRTKILDKANSINVKLIFYDYKTRKQQFIFQFNLKEDSLNSPEYFKTEFLAHSCKKDTNNFKKGSLDFTCRGDKMGNFIETFKDTMPKTCNDFFETMNKHHLRFIEDLKIGHNTIIDTISFPLSSAFWLSDNSALAFSLNSLGKKAQESTFLTRDPSIIGFVIKTFDNLDK